MNAVFTMLSSLCVTLAACAVVGAGMERHREDFFSSTRFTLLRWALKRCSPRVALGVGWAMLGVSWLLCAQHWAAALATLVWLGLLTLAASAQGLLWTYAPRQGAVVADAALSVGAGLALAAFL